MILYIINLIFDPCRNYEPGCCYDRYGTPEYINRQNSSLQNLVMEDNQAQNLGESRVGDQLLIIDPICLALEEPLGACWCGKSGKMLSCAMFTLYLRDDRSGQDPTGGYRIISSQRSNQIRFGEAASKTTPIDRARTTAGAGWSPVRPTATYWRGEHAPPRLQARRHK